MADERSRSRFGDTERLAQRVLDGEVVFFVGSGFSIDSEGNSADRLVGRLLAAILALGTTLGEEQSLHSEHTIALLDRLCRIFELEGADRPGDAAREPARCMTHTNLKRLAREYFSFNDWATSALGVLSGELVALDEKRRKKLALRAQKLATYLLTLTGDTVPLDPINVAALREFRNDAVRGKALFLDTMGFANDAIMAGTPLDPDIEQVARSYGNRIRPRHHALARLAREGLAGTLVTTNYDLLLEGAYRLTGFVEREHSEFPDGTPSDRLPRFSSIAGANQFFAQGRGYRTALLLKIHGCAQQYRRARERRLADLASAQRNKTPVTGLEQDAWASYLPALVFTYREIQTWRSDAWSRDLIRTLLRTHTIALCGYSGADPIMHATFREVYDEKVASRDVAIPPLASTPGAASVFFFGLARRREFHSLEILRAATLAAGIDAGKLSDHPNHIEFERGSGFPTVDDHFRWLTHCVVRKLSRDALSTHLRGLLPRLIGLPVVADQDLESFRHRYQRLCDSEVEAVAGACPISVPSSATSPGSTDAAHRIAEQRMKFEAITGWAWYFVPGLLREFALADIVASYQGAGRAVRKLRKTPFYQPLSERPEWTAWAAILELALRSLVLALNTRNLPGAGEPSSEGLIAENSLSAAISFRVGDPWEAYALCVRIVGFERIDGTPPLTGAFRRVTYWQLNETEIPWPSKRDGSVPSAKQIWEWAAGLKRPTRKQALRYLGIQR